MLDWANHEMFDYVAIGVLIVFAMLFMKVNEILIGSHDVANCCVMYIIARPIFI